MTTNSMQPAPPRHRLHTALGQMPGLRRSFTAKVLLVAFLGIHVPLLALLVYFVGSSALSEPFAVRVTVLALAATLIGTALTVLALKALLQPIRSVSDMLRGYQQERRLPPAIWERDDERLDELDELTRRAARALTEFDEQFDRLVGRDRVTGALNSHGLETALRRHTGERAAPAALVLMELRDFGHIEVALGREAADFVARSTVDRLHLAFGDEAVLAALGRGRFGAFLTGLALEELDTHLGRAMMVMKRPLEIQGREVHLPCAVGVGRSEVGEPGDKLWVTAEGALLAAREEDSSAWVEASESGERIRARVELAIELDRAIARCELFPVYQPRVTAADERIASLEALVRWNHPTRGLMAAGMFVPIAETGGRIVQIGQFMLDRAIAQAAAWSTRGVGVSVNVAARQLADRRLGAAVAEALTRHSLAPEALELEITESSLLLDLDGALPQLWSLREMGVQLALDDFGTGYCSLNYLNRIPVHRLKIDRSFVSQLHSARTRRLVRGIIELAEGLDLEVTAEGVETRQQADMLHAMGCNELQGFLYARPMPVDEVPWDRLQRGVRRSAANSAEH